MFQTYGEKEHGYNNISDHYETTYLSKLLRVTAWLTTGRRKDQPVDPQTTQESWAVWAARVQVDVNLAACRCLWLNILKVCKKVTFRCFRSSTQYSEIAYTNNLLLSTESHFFFFFKWSCFLVQFSSVAQRCPTLCDPHGLQHARLPCPSPSPRAYTNSCPWSQWYHHQLPGFTQTHVHWVSDAIQPSHPLSSPSPPALNLSPNEGLFKWVNSSHQVAKVLKFQLQHQSFQWIARTDLLQNGLVGSPCSPRDSQESSPTPQFKSINSSALCLIHSPTLTSIHDYWKNHSFD